MLGVKLLQRQDGEAQGPAVYFRPQHLAVEAGEQPGESGDLQGQGAQTVCTSPGSDPGAWDDQPVPSTASAVLLAQTDRQKPRQSFYTRGVLGGMEPRSRGSGRRQPVPKTEFPSQTRRLVLLRSLRKV